MDIVETSDELIEDIPSTLPLLTKEQLEKKLLNSDLVSFIREQFEFASNDRIDHEKRWLAALRDYRGEYSTEEKQNIAEARIHNPQASSVFVKIAKTKTMTAYGQILDVLFADNKFPLQVRPTTEPSGVPNSIFIVPEQLEDTFEDVPVEDAIGFPGDGQELKPGATQVSLLAGLQKKLKGLLKGKSVIEGDSPSPEFPEFSPAEEASQEMNKTIQDQLEETNAKFALRRSTHEQVIYGTGILKGPLPFHAVQHRYERDPETGELVYVPDLKLSPKIQQVSIWNMYPDPDALNQDDMSFVIERHLVNRSTLRALKRNLSFDKDAINRVLKQEPNHTPQDWEQEIRDSKQQPQAARYELLEYWGWLDEHLAERLNLEFDQDKEIRINAWIGNGELLKVVINPIIPQTIPYHFIPYEEHPNQIWGIGIPENMRDSQQLMNGHWRLAIDNLRFAGNIIFEVNQDTLAPNQDMTMFPGKIIRTQGGSPGQSLFATKYPDTSPSHMAAYDKARQLADEETGIVSFGQGSTQLPSSIRTADQTSQLLQGSALTIKTVVKNIDHYGLNRLGQALFHWNMQFNSENLNIRGDINIVASGTSSLVQRGIKSQRLLSFLQIGASNQATAPMLNYTFILEEIAKTLDLDPSKVVNSPERAKLFAELMQISQTPTSGGPQQPGTAPQNLASLPGGSSPDGGTIGGDVSGTPEPGEQGFSANTGAGSQ